MQVQAEKNRKELSQIYSYVRELILEREQALRRQISDNLIREEDESQGKLTEIGAFMHQIGLVKQESVQQCQENEIELLIKAKARAELTQEVNGPKAKDLKDHLNKDYSSCASLQEIKRDVELLQISKVVNPNYKGSVAQSKDNFAGPGSSLYSHTQSTANKLRRGQTLASNNVQTVNNIMNQQNSQTNIELKGVKEDQLLRKSTKNHMKSKVSPHRNIRKTEAKKNGVVVLDQNKGLSKSNAKQGKGQASLASVVQQHINLYNYNQQPHGGANDTDDLGALPSDDMSSIYPLEGNDCYYNYSPKDINKNLHHLQGFQNFRGQESCGNLNDLLDSLNKSISHQDCHNKQESSTASDTAGSASDGAPVPNELCQNQASNHHETPKTKQGNQWIQNQKSFIRADVNKEGSISDFDQFKSQQTKIKTPSQAVRNTYYDGIGDEKSPSSQQKLQGQSESDQETNVHQFYFNIHEKVNDYNDHHVQRSRSRSGCQQRQGKNPSSHALQSLSQERRKRKAQRAGTLSKDISPNKNNDNDLMIMLQQCTKNIEKLEFVPSAKKQKSNKQSEANSPIKQQSTKTAAVCLVDLTKREDDEEVDKIQQCTLRPKTENEVADGIDNDELEKNILHNSQQKEGSPFKGNETSLKQEDNAPNVVEVADDARCPNSPLKMSITGTGDIQENNFTDQSALISGKQNLGITTLGQSMISMDTSVADPFKALCRMQEEFIFVFSGFNDSKLLSCEALDIQRGVWKEVAQISKPRTKFSAVPISKSRILIFGGKQVDGQRTGEIEEYNLKTNKFKTLPFKMPKPRSGFSSCVKRDEGKIFFCGGNSGSVLRKFDCLDLKKGKWSRLPEMIHKRDELAVALGPDGKIYAIGGYGGGSSSSNANQESTPQNQSESKSQSNCLRTAERFDFVTGQWEMLPEMNEARRALAAVALPDGIYAIGGYDGKQYLSSVEKFDLQKQQWVKVKSMNTSRCTLAAVASSDCQYIYALGGFNGNSLDLVERYNIMSDEWEFTTPMISKRFMHEAVNLVTH